MYDIPSSNGVLHVIDKVLYPAPVYEKPAAQWRTKAEMEAELSGGSPDGSESTLKDIMKSKGK